MKAAAVGLGLLIAFVGTFLGFGLAGAGHGWVTAFWVSVVLWVGYPVALVRAYRGGPPRVDWLISLTFVSDAALLLLTRHEGVQYFWRVIDEDGWWLVGLWIAIWLGWQVVALVNLIRAGTPTQA
jgi:hypothetical protein